MYNIVSSTAPIIKYLNFADVINASIQNTAVPYVILLYIFAFNMAEITICYLKKNKLKISLNSQCKE